MPDSAERVLFVHARPGDETVFTGATIATLVDRGAAVTVLTCTLPAGDSTELDAALAVLGVADHRILGQPGARWEGREPRTYGGPDSFVAAERGEVTADVAAAMILLQPDVVVSYGADGGGGHPDRIRAHEATRTAAEVLRVPFYAIDGDSPRGPVQVDPTPVLDRKRGAMQAYRSQTVIGGDAVESFTRLRPPVPAFRDHSLASRITAFVIAVLFGAFTGATLTAAHQASATVGPLTIPWGIVVALVVTTALLVGLRIVFRTRAVALCAAVGLLGASALLAVQSQGGSVLVPANPIGYIWTFGPALIAFLVLAWPQLDRPAVQGHRGTIETPAAKGPDPK